MAQNTVSAGYARSLVDYAAARGAERGALLAAAGLRDADIADMDRRVPHERYVALMRAAKAQTGDPALALHWSEDVNLSDVSVVGLLGYASRTMGEAFVQLQRYARLVVEVDLPADAPTRFSHVPAHGGLWIVDHRADPDALFEHTETAFARMVCGTRRFGTTPFVLEAHVTHADPGYRAEYERILGAPVRFGQAWNAMRIDPAWVAYPIQIQPAYVFGILARHADALMDALQGSKTVRGQVESLLMPRLHTGEAGIDEVAGQLAMSRQTLYRRLRDEGATFAGVLDDLRRRMALDYLSARRVSVNEAAYLVGFSDPAAFSRAFKRWTGASPRAYLALNGDASP
jgi:AraC-like DNA-binding protein